VFLQHQHLDFGNGLALLLFLCFITPAQWTGKNQKQKLSGGIYGCYRWYNQPSTTTGCRVLDEENFPSRKRWKQGD
jgi:hypothetical protein